MKKILFAVTVIFAFGFSNAQIREKGEVELDVKIGSSSANYYSTQKLEGNSAVSGVNFGIEADYFFNKTWSLRSGLLLQTMGTKGSGFVEKLNYATIPVNANWHFGSTKKWNLNFGPSLGFLTSAETNGNDISKLVNGFQLGLNYGIGYKIEVSKQFSVMLDLQSMSGLSDVNTDGPFYVRNAYSSFNIGGVFKL